MYIFPENVYWEIDFLKLWIRNIFCSTDGETQCVDMQIYYIIKTKLVKLFFKEIAHVKLHDNFLSQKEIENYMLIFFPSYFIMFHAAEKISPFKPA